MFGDREYQGWRGILFFFFLERRERTEGLFFCFFFFVGSAGDVIGNPNTQRFQEKIETMFDNCAMGNLLTNTVLMIMFSFRLLFFLAT